MKVEIYVRPLERLLAGFEDTAVRIYYNGQWVDFRGGEIVITKDESAKEPTAQLDGLD